MGRPAKRVNAHKYGVPAREIKLFLFARSRNAFPAKQEAVDHALIRDPFGEIHTKNTIPSCFDSYLDLVLIAFRFVSSMCSAERDSAGAIGFKDASIISISGLGETKTQLRVEIFKAAPEISYHLNEPFGSAPGTPRAMCTGAANRLIVPVSGRSSNHRRQLATTKNRPNPAQYCTLQPDGSSNWKQQSGRELRWRPLCAYVDTTLPQPYKAGD